MIFILKLTDFFGAKRYINGIFAISTFIYCTRIPMNQPRICHKFSSPHRHLIASPASFELKRAQPHGHAPSVMFYV